MKNFAAVMARQIEIEDDELELIGWYGLLLVQNLKDFSSIGRHLQRHIHTVLFERNADEEDVRGIIFGQENLIHSPASWPAEQCKYCNLVPDFHPALCKT